MLFMRKSKYFMVTAIILMIFIVFCNLIYSDNIYPLEAGEKLIEETVIDENHVEIYTQINEDFHLKKLQKNGGQWTLESVETIHARRTGLDTNETGMMGDMKLAAALENELKSYGLEAATLPSVLDYSHSEFLPPSGDQRYQSSCVGWATGYYLRTYQQAQEMGWKVKESGVGIDSHIFSPSFIYNQLNNGVDEGALITKAGDLLMNVGAATLADFPYVVEDYRTQPNSAVMQSAYPYRVREWMLLYSDRNSTQYIIEKTKEYLNTGDLVVAGNLIGFKFMYPSTDQYGNSIITREDDPHYKHAFVVVGYDDNFNSSDGLGAFKVVSSWGQGWGNDGFSYISYKAFAANALEGFVFTDLVNGEPQELTLDINDNVIFNMNFSGTGRFDIKIKNANDQLIYEENNLHGQPGLRTLTWNGKDKTENNVADGSYKFSIIPYKNDVPKQAFDATFTKLGKVESASAWAYSNRNGIQYVDIPITFKSEGMFSIKVDYNGTVQELISDQAVKAGESNTYIILKRDFDFNNMDLNQVKIAIDICPFVP